MVHYSIDKNSRTIVYYFSTFVAILLTPLLNLLIEELAKTNQALEFIKNFHLTGFIIFGLLLFLFKKWMWKSKNLSGIPNLNGIWEGHYVRYQDGAPEMPISEIRELFINKPDENKIQIIIEQDWLKMSLIYQSQASESISTVIDLKIENSKIYTLQWIFDSKERTGITPSNKYGIGTSTARINVLEDKEILEGTYFTQKGKKGFFRVRKVNIPSKKKSWW
ncbi:MAG: hypothetical protein EPO58_12665 [Chitinophagaceae bacterium]|nr:MAG: hypothetical protein EPO58_12665 [Chitinophagaceae bacterium]